MARKPSIDPAIVIQAYNDALANGERERGLRTRIGAKFGLSGQRVGQLLKDSKLISKITAAPPKPYVIPAPPEPPVGLDDLRIRQFGMLERLVILELHVENLLLRAQLQDADVEDRPYHCGKRMYRGEKRKRGNKQQWRCGSCGYRTATQVE